MKRTSTTICLALTLVLASSFALTGAAAPPALEKSVAAVACPVAPSEDLLGLETPAATPMSSCTDDCYAQLLSCLDDCDAWPYPGCYNDCRAARLVCVQTCF
jgi:hypothetical protein